MHNASPTPQSQPQQSLSIFSQNPINLFAILGLVGLLIAYTSGLLSQAQLSFFNRNLADLAFLGLIIFSALRQLKNSTSIVDPIYWLLLGSAFTAWFVLTIFRFTIFSSLSASTIGLITNLCYFLYYSLMIAAIRSKVTRKQANFFQDKAYSSG